MREKLHNLIRRFQVARAGWPTVPDPVRQQEQVWYAGLAVSPSEFSTQLAGLQVSLQRESVPAKSRTEVTQIM